MSIQLIKSEEKWFGREKKREGKKRKKEGRDMGLEMKAGGREGIGRGKKEKDF